MSKTNRSVEDRLKTVEVLLSGLLLKEEPRPEVTKLEKLIGVRKGTLSDLFPQRPPKSRKVQAKKKA